MTDANCMNMTLITCIWFHFLKDYDPTFHGGIIAHLPPTSASWVIPVSPYSVLYVYVLKPRSWLRDKHFLAVVLDIVHDKWRAVRVVGRALFSQPTWFFQVAFFSAPGFVCVLFVLTACVYETHTQRETVPYEVLINVCLTHTDAGLYSSKPPRKTENKPKPTRKIGPYRLQLSFWFHSNKCHLDDLSQIVWHLKAERCQSRNNMSMRQRRFCLWARPSGLFWPVFQRSDVWLSYRNYFFF